MMYRSYINKDGLRISLAEAIYKQVTTEAARYYPKECGGVFVGRIDTISNTAVIERMIMPAKVKSTKVLFRRTAGKINRLLKEIFDQTQGEQYYLGEWHSHPNALPVPSNKDISTMQGIAHNDDIRIKTPLLLIVGYMPGAIDEQFYIFSNNTLINYEQERGS